jgi:2-haloacid dehalogenase
MEPGGMSDWLFKSASAVSRRAFLSLFVAGGAAAAAQTVPARRGSVIPKIRALAFDAFPILDPRPVFSLAEELFPGRGADLSSVWRTRQFEYQWLRALSGRYADFQRTTEDALVFAAAMLRLDLTPDKRHRLMGAYLELTAWPDVSPALRSLRCDGVRLAFLSNATPAILQAGIRNSGLEGIFEHVLSTDSIKTYKPDPRTYRMAMDAFGLRREEIAFVAFAGWDAAGAKSFGYPTFWTNRLNLPAEELGALPDAVGKSLDDLLTYLRAQQC